MDDGQLIGKWLYSPPSDESAETVERILVRYFGSGVLKKSSGGSHHYRVKHPALADLPGFGIGGYLSIPVKNGSRVKGFYLRRIAQAIKRLEEAALDGES